MIACAFIYEYNELNILVMLHMQNGDVYLRVLLCNLNPTACVEQQQQQNLKKKINKKSSENNNFEN